MKTLIALIFLCTAQLSFAQTNTNRVYTGDWSEVTNGLRARLEISDSGRIDGKIHYSIVYLELENHDDVANPMEIYFDDEKGLKSRLTNDSGDSPAAGGVVSEFRAWPYWLVLPRGGKLRFPISAEGHNLWSESGGMAVVLHGNRSDFGASWVVPDQAAEDYYLSASLTVTPPEDPTRPPPWQGVLQIPKVKIPRKAPQSSR